MYRLALPTLRAAAPVSRRTFVASAASRDLKSAADQLNQAAGNALKTGASHLSLCEGPRRERALTILCAPRPSSPHLVMLDLLARNSLSRLVAPPLRHRDRRVCDRGRQGDCQLGAFLPLRRREGPGVALTLSLSLRNR